MKNRLIISSFFLLFIFCNLGFSQTQTIQITGPSQVSGPVVVTLEINPPPGCAVTVNPGTSTVQVNNTQTLVATPNNCPVVEDILDWLLKSDRTTNHISGTGNPGYTWLDADGLKLWLIKGSGGFPWDIYPYDGDYVYRWITENLFTNASSYKRSLNTNTGTIIPSGVPALPRYFVTSGTYNIFTPQPNNGLITGNCETDSPTTHDIKDVLNILQASPVTTNWGGDVGTVPTIEWDYYFGGSGGIYQSWEQAFLVKGWGRVSWQPFVLQNGVYVATSPATLHNINTAGGAPTPVFPCSGTIDGNWMGGVPGAGGNVSAPVHGSVPVKWSVNGIANGNTLIGIINQGLYTAPANAPNPSAVSVTANSVATPSAIGRSTITVLQPPCTVGISPHTANVQTLTTQSFVPTTTHCSPSTVSWFVNNVQGGDSTHGTINNTGLYTAPSSVPTPATVTIKGASNQNQTIFDTAVVTVTAPATACSVVVSPKTASVLTNGTQVFSANASTCTPTTVTWKVNGTTGGNSTVGTISVGGTYTAPASVPTPNTITISAVSNQDNTTQDTAVVTISAPAICSVSINPITTSVQTTITQQFTATALNCSPSTVFWQVNSINGGNSTVGTINGSGLYTAPAAVPSPSTVTVTAVSNANNAKTASAMVTIFTPSTSVMDQDCLKGDVPAFPTRLNKYAKLPKSCFYTDPSVTTPTGTVRQANASTWNSVVTATQCGDIIELAAGSTMLGNFTFTKTGCDKLHYVWIRTSGYASLPAYGSKLDPCYNGVSSLPGRPAFNCGSLTNVMATIQSNTGIPFILGVNTKYVKITGVKFTITANTTQIAKFIDNNAGGIDHVILDHDMFAGTDTNDMNGGLVLDRTSYFAVLNSFFFNIHCTVGLSCTDAKDIGGGCNGNATDTDNAWKIVGNYLEASGEEVIFGGCGAQIAPSDIEVRANYFFKPLIWMPTSPTYNGGNPTNHQPYIVKNHIEMKNAVRILIEGNYFENVWGGFSQVGAAILISPKNQAGPNGSNLCPLCLVTDYTLRNNHTITASQALQMINVGSDNGGMAAGGNSYDIYHNLWDNLKYPGCSGCSGATILWDETQIAPSNFIHHHEQIRHNTFVLSSNNTLTPPGQSIPFMNTGGHPVSDGLQMNTIDFNDNLFAAGLGITTPGGGSANCAFNLAMPAIISNCWLPRTFTGNAVIQPNGMNWAFFGTACTAETSYNNMFVNYNNGNGGNYVIKNTSVCHNTASDGTDPGGDIPAINTATQGVNVFP
jgi:hypothetical protein